MSRRFLIPLAFAACFVVAQLALAQSTVIMGNVTATGAGGDVACNLNVANKTYQVWGSVPAGTGTAVVSVEGSNDGIHFDVIGSVPLALTATAAVSNSFTSADRYARCRGNVTTLTGAGASANLTVGY